MSDYELKLTKGERNFYDFMVGEADKFYDSLFRTILIATAKNKQLLSKAFPEEVASVSYYQNIEGYWTQLRARIEEEKALKGSSKIWES